jgi:hypothetical protein
MAVKPALTGRCPKRALRRSECELAWGPDTDRHDKYLKFLDTKGSYFGSDSHLMILSAELAVLQTGESAPCEPAFESRRLCRVGWLSRV